MPSHPTKPEARLLCSLFLGHIRKTLHLFSILLLLACLGLCFFPVEALAKGERIAVASYPVFLFTRYLNNGRDNFQVELMTSPGTGCPHEFNPRPQDLEKLSETGILVENGLNLEIYLDRALSVAKPDIFIIDASVGVPTIPNNRARVKVVGDPAGTDNEPNPHIFFSPKNASIMAANIAKGLTTKDPEGATHYQERLKLFQDSMAALEKDIQAFKDTHTGYKVVASHNFIDYFTDELGLVVVADIEAVPDVAPSPARLTDLTRVIKEQKVSAILLEPEADLNQAKTLGRETGVQVEVIDPATSGSGDPPVDYFQDVIKKDLALLTKALPANAPAK
ncbi:MAG: metal ABC transporter substrate-binding protein [Deltaproteobacteria bacterium]|jgi:ABC-type Zn uptake system ZnuABC Zn-binding protein ZnuA|nr:metal ABC transporter substrate-binding protein [Deltaproteobacteria bacterium]